MNATDQMKLATECRTIVAFLRALGGNPIMDQMFSSVEATIEKGDLRGLKSIRRDLGEWTRGLTPDQRSALQASLTSAGCGPVVDTPEEDDAGVAQILARGRIESRNEYVRVQAWLERALASGGAPSQLEKADELLTRFSTKI